MIHFTGGKYPETHFSSPEEVEPYVRELIAKALLEKPHLKDVDCEEYIKMTVDQVKNKSNIPGRNGAVLTSTIEMNVGKTIRHAEGIWKDSIKFSQAVTSEAENAKNLGRRNFLKGGIALGGALAVYGAVAATTAVDKNDHNKRDWPKTALNTGLAISGAAMTWVSALALKGKGPLAR